MARRRRAAPSNQPNRRTGWGRSSHRMSVYRTTGVARVPGGHGGGIRTRLLTNRSTVDLPRLPYAFTQLKPFSTSKFSMEARDRGVSLTENALEALHRVGILVPFFRAQRDGRAIASAARRGDQFMWEFAHTEPTGRHDLLELRKHGRLHDPAVEHFIARHRLDRSAGDVPYRSSVYLYSGHQIITLPLVRNVMARLNMRLSGTTLIGATLDIDASGRAYLLEQAATLREIAVALSALEPVYYSRVVETLSMPVWEDFEEFYEWRRTRRPESAVRWLRVNAEWLSKSAEGLLAQADAFDPLGDWLEVIADGEPEKWTRLRGPARRAMDLRTAAEILLLCHDDLVKKGHAKPLPDPSPRTRGQFHSRLKRRRPLDALLTDFGLSPHPRLVVVVEGATELTLFPRVMLQLGIRVADDFISVQDAEGVDKDPSPLLAYAVAPRVEERPGGKYLNLLRPPTRVFVVMDAEGKFATKELREDRRKNWVDRLERTLPAEFQTRVVRTQLERLVDTATWKRSGESFEFAHFTDHQLERAIRRLDKRPRPMTTEQRLRLLAHRRKVHKSLDPVLHGVSKRDLAHELWPVLEKKIEAALSRRADRQIPIVRVVDRAYRFALELPRKNLVIALDEP